MDFASIVIISITSGIVAGIIFGYQIINETIAISMFVLITASIFLLKRKRNEQQNKRITKKCQADAKPEYQSIIKPDYANEYYKWPSSGQFYFDVVGESFYQNNIEKIANDNATDKDDKEHRDIQTVKAYLIPDNDNPYDNMAVRIDIDGMTVGHLERNEAKSFRRRLSAQKMTGRITICDAIVVGGYIKNGQKAHYGIRLDIKPFDR